MNEFFVSKSSQRLLFVITVILLILILERAYVGGNDWRYTHWLFSYESGFIKRGLVGSFFELLGLNNDFFAITYWWNSVVFLVVCAFAYLSFRWLHNGKVSKGVLIFGLVFLTSSATVQHFTYDLGRFDSLNFLVTLVLLGVISHYQALPKRMVYALVMTLCALMILIHEAAFFMFVPLVFAYWLYKDQTGLFYKLIGFVFICIFTVFISTQGLLKEPEFNEYQASLIAKHGTQVSESSLNVLQRDVKSNVAFTAQSLDTKRLIDHLAFFVAFTPLFYLFFLVFVNTKLNWRMVLLLSSAWAPLVLYPLGEDHFRWWAMAVTNFFMVLLFLTFQHVEFRNRIAEVFTKKAKLSYFIIVLSILLGPLGNPSAYPFTLNQYIVKAL